MIEKEIWKVYKDTRRPSGKGTGSGSHNGMLYEISNLGRVKKNGILFNVKPLPSGYLFFNHMYVHRMVAEAFIPNPDNKPCIDHIDSNRQNNTVSNLRWSTTKENMNNPITTERIRKTLLGRKLPEETAKKIKEKLKGRKRVYHDDGTWNMKYVN